MINTWMQVCNMCVMFYLETIMSNIFSMFAWWEKIQYLTGSNSGWFCLVQMQRAPLKILLQERKERFVYVPLDLAFSLKYSYFSAHKDIIIFKIHIYKSPCHITGKKCDYTISALFKSLQCGINSTLDPCFVKSWVSQRKQEVLLCLNCQKKLMEVRINRIK